MQRLFKFYVALILQADLNVHSFPPFSSSHPAPLPPSARMKGELEFLQGAFEAYKSTLTQDMVEKWTKKENDMKLKFHEELERELSEQSKAQNSCI